jgi:thymidine phosphorylase
VRAGHSVADPVPDDDIRRVVQALVYEGADEAEVYRVREAMRRAGDRVTSHT